MAPQYVIATFEKGLGLGPFELTQVCGIHPLFEGPEAFRFSTRPYTDKTGDAIAEGYVAWAKAPEDLTAVPSH